ncbi:MAG: 3-carboxy-cis,cis-muconate cycloisomerase [Trueperaceae bacterium]
MSFSPADSTIFGPLFSGTGLEAVFRDDVALQHMIAFEAALARVQGRFGVIPTDAAAAIDAGLASVEPGDLDLARLRERTAVDGVPVPDLVTQLRARLGPDAGAHLHWGATSQDVMDTALVLQLRDALPHLTLDLDRTVDALAAAARAHRDTPMLGRTHGRQALPITFGLKVAGWLAPLARYRARLQDLAGRMLLLQFGGAAGTLSSLGVDGVRVRQALAEELGLGLPPMPWHTQRDGLAELAAWLAGVSGALAKMAQDVIAMGQEEFGEVLPGPVAGGSSTLPQKQNPIQAEMIVVAARANAGLLATFHQAMVQEHERGTHGWQLEWTALGQMLAYASSALDKGAQVATGLRADTGRMMANLEASRGAVLAEPCTFALARHMALPDASQLVKDALRAARAENVGLIAAVRARTDAPLDWDALADVRNALGSAQAFVDAVLAEIEGGASPDGTSDSGTEPTTNPTGDPEPDPEPDSATTPRPNDPNDPKRGNA